MYFSPDVVRGQENRRLPLSEQTADVLLYQMLTNLNKQTNNETT